MAERNSSKSAKAAEVAADHSKEKPGKPRLITQYK
jgi:hypothetical protein